MADGVAPLAGRPLRKRSAATPKPRSWRPQGKHASQRYLDLRGEIVAAEAEAAEPKKRSSTSRIQPVSEKRSLIEARQNVEQLKVDLALAFAEAQNASWTARCSRKPGNKSGPCGAGSGSGRTGSKAPSAAATRRTIAYAKVMIERYADAPLSEEGAPGAAKRTRRRTVTLARFEEQDGVLDTGGRARRSAKRRSVRYEARRRAVTCACSKRMDTTTRAIRCKIEREQTWDGRGDAQDRRGDRGGVRARAGGGVCVRGGRENRRRRRSPTSRSETYPVTFAAVPGVHRRHSTQGRSGQERMPQDAVVTARYVERGDDGTWRVLPDPGRRARR